MYNNSRYVVFYVTFVYLISIVLYQGFNFSEPCRKCYTSETGFKNQLFLYVVATIFLNQQSSLTKTHAVSGNVINRLGFCVCFQQIWNGNLNSAIVCQHRLLFAWWLHTRHPCRRYGRPCCARSNQVCQGARFDQGDYFFTAAAARSLAFACRVYNVLWIVVFSSKVYTSSVVSMTLCVCVRLFYCFFFVAFTKLSYIFLPFYKT